MSITAFFRTLSSRSHWAIHSVWLVVLAGVLCVNVVDGYFQLQENELRRLLSESSIAVNIVKMEVGGITHLLDTVESAAIAHRDEAQLADSLQGLVRDNPFVAAIAVEFNGVPRASTGAIPSASSAVFSRSTAKDGLPSVSVSIALQPEFWGYKLAYAFSRADAKVSVYTAPASLCCPLPTWATLKRHFWRRALQTWRPMRQRCTPSPCGLMGRGPCLPCSRWQRHFWRAAPWWWEQSSTVKTAMPTGMATCSLRC